MTTITCAREGCGVTKAVRKRSQRFCSHQCDMASRDPQSKRESGLRGGSASGKARWHRALAAWRQRYPEIPAVLARDIYARGYSAGFNARRRAEERA